MSLHDVTEIVRRQIAESLDESVRVRFAVPPESDGATFSLVTVFRLISVECLASPGRGDLRMVTVGTMLAWTPTSWSRVSVIHPGVQVSVQLQNRFGHELVVEVERVPVGVPRW